jgi:hypothetical protein
MVAIPGGRHGSDNVAGSEEEDGGGYSSLFPTQDAIATAAKLRHVNRLLREAGIDESELDPESVDALGDILMASSLSSCHSSQPWSKQKASRAEELRSREEEEKGGEALPPSPTWSSGSATGAAAPSDDGLDGVGRDSTAVTYRIPSGALTPLLVATAPAGDAPEAAAVTTAAASAAMHLRILRKLDEQARLIAELRDRVDDLSAAIVGGGGRGGEGSIRSSEGSVRRYAQQPRPVLPPLRPPPGQLQPAATDNMAPPGEAADAAARAPHLPWIGSIVEFLSVEVPRRIHDSRPAKIVRLYRELRRRQVPDADFGGLFRVLLMVGILAARLSTRRSNNQSQPSSRQLHESATLSEHLLHLWRLYRVPIATALVVMGFLVHSGYARFLYNFFVKEDYPGRIWDGEDIDPDHLVGRERQQQQQQPPNRPEAPDLAAPNGAAGGPQVPPQQQQEQPNAERRDPVAEGVGQYVLAGRIPRHEDDDNGEEDLRGGRGPARRRQRRHAAPVQLLIEIGYLLSSFVLSIFPTWRPVARNMDNRDDEDDANPDNGNDDYDDRGGDDNHDPDQLPQIRQPQDPAEYDDDDDDDDDH